VTAVQRGKSERAEALVKMKIGKLTNMSAAEGVGPVHALDAALRKSLLERFPSLASVRLVDYKVRVVDNESGTGAKVRVWIQATDGHTTWSTVGASANIVSASAAALIDSFEYSLMVAASAQSRERLTG
jgi:2-isopropylmalate synthase